MRAVLLILIVILLLVAVFAVQNPGIVTVRFLNLSGDTSLLVVIAAAFAAGAACAALCAVPGWFRKRARIRELTAELAARPKAPAPPPPKTGAGDAP
ncbi:MAG: lipopolysaccharide assembly protein LapA domain-containing protein [Deltaproteobacteria bacterium]|nr:lipopolysaccharide assembly protein LapA domain-containing protein [Deltaproteobacteria bacterium]